jgi:hypothetical protein
MFRIIAQECPGKETQHTHKRAQVPNARDSFVSKLSVNAEKRNGEKCHLDFFAWRKPSDAKYTATTKATQLTHVGID